MNNPDYWQQQFETLPPADLSQSARQEAWARWQRNGFPNMRHERWKYTELMPLKQINFNLISDDNLEKNYEKLLPAVIEDSLRIIIVNGLVISNDTQHLGKDKIICLPLAEALEKIPEQREALFSQSQPFIDSIDDLNTALAVQGLVIIIPKNSQLTQPIHLIYIHTATDDNSMLHLQNKIILNENSTATIIEHHIGQDESCYFSTAINTVKIAKNANLHFYRWQEQGNKSYHINRLYLQQAENSIAHLFSMDLKGHLLRNETLQVFAGEQAQCHLSGLYLGQGKQHIDNYLTLDHAQPYCLSSQLFKGILDDRSHCVFSGKVIVAKDAQKTDAKQHNANLILSNQAEIDTQPQLEIYADDVKCTHGAAIGQLDEDALFYLQSRGLDAATAKQLLVYSFVAEVLQTITQETISDFCKIQLGRYFPALALLGDAE